MKRLLYLFVLAALSNSLMGQQWCTSLSDGLDGSKWISDMVSADEGECAVGAGARTFFRTMDNPMNHQDGYVVKVDKDGNLASRIVHLPGKTLAYYSVLQIPNGNFMAFGICDDTLTDYHYQKYLRVDIFDGQLDLVSSRTYSVDDDIYDCFAFPFEGHCMKSAVTNAGTVLLSARPSFQIEPGAYYPSLRLYEFDEMGDTLRTHDTVAGIGSVKEVTRIPDTDNLLIVLDGGSFGYNSGIVGVYEIDTALNIVRRQHLANLNGSERISDLACEGKWIEDRYLILDGEQHIQRGEQGRGTFYYHSLFVVDADMNPRAELRLPPYDSTTQIPLCTNTAYANDSTIFAISYSFGPEMEASQVNVLLVDKHLNLLGRKVLRKADVKKLACHPAAFNDASCVFMLLSRDSDSFQGEPFSYQELVKFRREDIEITWDAVHEEHTEGRAYPNPSRDMVNIPVGEMAAGDARIQIFDGKGAKCLDSAIGTPGNLITLDIHNLDSGLYVYRVVSGNREMASGKFIRE